MTGQLPQLQKCRFCLFVWSLVWFGWLVFFEAGIICLQFPGATTDPAASGILSVGHLKPLQEFKDHCRNLCMFFQLDPVLEVLLI